MQQVEADYHNECAKLGDAIWKQQKNEVFINDVQSRIIELEKEGAAIRATMTQAATEITPTPETKTEAA